MHNYQATHDTFPMGLIEIPTERLDVEGVPTGVECLQISPRFHFRNQPQLPTGPSDVVELDSDENWTAAPVQQQYGGDYYIVDRWMPEPLHGWHALILPQMGQTTVNIDFEELWQIPRVRRHHRSSRRTL